MKDPRVFKPADRILYCGLGAYLLAYLVWVAVARGDALFDSAFFMMFVLPVVALGVFVIWQFSKMGRRFSLVANLVGALVIVGAPGLIVSIVSAASAAV